MFTLLASLAHAAPPELESLQDSYNKKVAEVAAPAVKNFAHDLTKIAHSYASRGDYENAAATKRKATTTLGLLESLKVSARGAISLPPTKASTTGPVSYSQTTASLGRFTKENARASWDLRQITPGTYKVSLTYSVNHRNGEDAGGTFQVSEDTKLQRSGSGTNSITHEIASTGGWDTYRTEAIGNISLASTSATIVIEALEPKPQGLMQLREIRLTPQGDRSSEHPATNQSAKILASLKRDHEARSLPLIAPLAAAYTSEITSIKNAATTAGDTQAARRATNILRQLNQHLEESPLASPTPTTHSSPSITLAAVDDLNVQLAGTTTPNASRSYLTQLGPEGEGAITWQLPSDRPDTQFYKISIRHRPTASSGGRFALTAGENKISRYLPRPKAGRLQSATFQDLSLGVLEIPSAAAAIQLRIESLDPDADSLADLESLNLQPLDDPSAAQKNITRQNSRYQNRLKDIADVWETIEITGPSPSDSARASTFQIKTSAGTTRELSLYGVRSLSPNYGESEEETEELEIGRRQLRLDQSDLERLGRKALNLLESTLATGTSTIYTRSDTGDDDPFVIITTEDGTPLSVLLASEGLAFESHIYGDKTFPEAIHPDLHPGVYERWIEGAIERAKRSQKGIWEKTR